MSEVQFKFLVKPVQFKFLVNLAVIIYLRLHKRRLVDVFIQIDINKTVRIVKNLLEDHGSEARSCTVL